MSNYTDFITSKVKLADSVGFTIDRALLDPSTFPHQGDAIAWAVEKGRALLGLSFGLGKTRIQLQVLGLIQAEKGGRCLIICPLGVRHQFTEEDGPALGLKVAYVRNDAEAEAADTPFLITNYERVRDSFDEKRKTPGFSAAFLASLTAVTLDEGSVLRSLGSKTTDVFRDALRPIPYRFVCTATPAPNRYKEILHYADFLGVMDTGQALTRWFKRDSQKAGNLTLHEHLADEFWLWVSSWALFLTRPSELGYDDTGYDLPALSVTWHRISSLVGENEVLRDRDGQTKLLADTAGNLQEAAAEKRRSLDRRVAKLTELVTDGGPDKHWLLWHHLEDERKAIETALPEACSVYGSQELEERETRLIDFAHGRFRMLATKPEIAGQGCNFQRHCHANVFLGITYQFEEFIQAVHRTHRFQQPHPVEVHILYTEAEEPIRRELERKWRDHEALMARMRELIARYGLSHTDYLRALTRAQGVRRQVASGARWVIAHNDCVEELRAGGPIADNSVGLICTSIPFGNHYEYSANLNDFGHNEDNGHFWRQMDFLIPNLLRALKPGRVAAIHVKDRIRYSSMTGAGGMTIDPFSDECVAAFRQHGFEYFGRITVLTDVVRENNQTYRLGFTECGKDGTKMGIGMPEYVLLFRKRPSDTANAYADEPVLKVGQIEGYKPNGDPIFRKVGGPYPLSRWQIDAGALWRSSGNRLLTPTELQNATTATVARLWRAMSTENVYDYDHHCALGEQLAEAGRLPSTFALLPATSWSPWYVWDDVNYMHSLNGEQFKRRAQNHICPLPFDIVDRIIERYSIEGEEVLDPFDGLGTTVVRALRQNRRGRGVELNPEYWKASVQYAKEAEYKASVPTLFDLFNEPTAGPEAQAA